jgi:hypothetical protein
LRLLYVEDRWLVALEDQPNPARFTIAYRKSASKNFSFANSAEINVAIIYVSRAEARLAKDP